MPEFRFRRKKQQNRRHTVHDSDAAHKQIKTAKQQIQQQQADKQAKPETEKRNSLVQEREKFFELLKDKYPEQANDLEVQQVLSNGEAGEDDHEGAGRHHHHHVNNGVGLHNNTGELLFGDDDLDDHTPNGASNGPITFTNEEGEGGDGVITTTSSSKLPSITASTRRRISNTYNECFFLQYGKSLRRCPMPSPITLSTIKNLYVNMFDISPQVLEDPHCLIYIKHKDTPQWEELQNVSMVCDHCTLLLVDTPTLAPPTDHAPSQTDSDINMPFTGSSQRSQGSQRSEVIQENGGSGETPTAKINGLWQSGRCLEVEDLTKLSDSLPLHTHPSHHHSNGDTSIMTSPFSLNSSTSGVYSDPPVDHKQLASKSQSLHTNVLSLKKELSKLREEHAIKMAEFSHSLGHTSERISGAVSALFKTSGVSVSGRVKQGVDVFRRERLELYGEEEGYSRCARRTLRELGILERAVEEMRVDVVQRRCRVDEGEVEALTLAVNTTGRDVEEIRELYDPLEAKMKRVMEQELQTIVSEEKYLREEGPKLEEAVEKRKKLQTILSTLKQFISVQTHRTPLIPIYSSMPNPDRERLIENIKAITPNHTHRVETLQLSETIQQKKKELYSPARKSIKRFESQLQIQRDHLQHRDVATLEESHLKNVQVLFMEEKKEREKKNREEFERRRQLEAMKHEQEKKQMEELWRWQNRARERGASDDNLKARQRQSQENVLKSLVGSGGGDHSSLVGFGSSNRRSNKGGGTTFHISRSDDRLLETGNETGGLHGMRVGDGVRDRRQQRTHGRTTFHVSRSDDQLLESGNRTREQNSIPLHVRTFSDDQTHHSIHNMEQPTHTGPLEPIRMGPAPLKGRFKKRMSQNDLIKRKSIGYSGEFEDLQMYYDSSNLDKNSRQSEVGSIANGERPSLQHPSTTSQSSFSSSGTSGSSKQVPSSLSTGSGRGRVGVVNTATTTTAAAVKHKHPKMNGFPNRYSMYEHHSQPMGEGDNSFERIGLTSSNSLSQPSAERDRDVHHTHGFKHDAFVSPRSKTNRPKQRSDLVESSNNKPNITLRSNSDDSLFEHSTARQQEQRDLHNDTSHMTHQQSHMMQNERHQNLSPTTENRSWAMDIFNSDTLPVSKERKKQSVTQQKQQSVVASNGTATQQHNVGSKVNAQRGDSQVTSRQQSKSVHQSSYTQHTPHSGGVGGGGANVTISSNRTAAGLSNPSTTHSSNLPSHSSNLPSHSSNPTSHSRKPRTQYPPQSDHARPHPSLNTHRPRLTTNSIPTHTHGPLMLHPSTHHHIPIRATKSAQTPSTHTAATHMITSDTQLTSYPRSYAAAMYNMQMRSASNGRPIPATGGATHHHLQLAAKPPRGSVNIKSAVQGGRGGNYKPHPLNRSTQGNDKESMLGSLV